MRLPQQPPKITEFSSKSRAGKPLLGFAPTLDDGRYLPWDQLRYREPPKGLTVNEWWSAIHMARVSARVPLAAMEACYGRKFGHTPLPEIDRRLHRLDRTNVQRDIIAAVGNEDAQLEYRARQLLEEAISSSEIEGARPTTRELARQLVRENRKPASKDERMILNNWRAMRRLLELHDAGEELTVERLLELHRILGDDSLEVEDAAGVFRRNEHHVDVADQHGNVWHIPPSAEGIEGRILCLLEFANAREEDEKQFVHPLLRAIVAHFWMGYEHPFRDGNGRMARALFYWSMLRQGYESASFLSISGPIDREQKDYYLAFAYTELEGGDLTYFLLNQLGMIQQALEELQAHLCRRAERIQRLSRAVRQFDELNHRQRSVLLHAIRHPFASYTIDSFSRVHNVHYMTARQDLADLEKRSLLVSTSTKPKRYRPAPELARIESHRQFANSQS